ncbi:MAG TPA: response regulator [Planctomycetota bacterium]|nr:response regulator [Planctomycetota bacterium]
MAGSRILVVDDDEACVLMVSAGLRKLGYEVAAATDGWDGLAQARAQKPELILLDVKMPQMDGWTFLGFLRNQKEFEKVPVIFLTGRTSEEDRKKGLGLGADDYLAKPVDLDRLKTCIEASLERRAKVHQSTVRMADPRRPKGRFGLRGRLDQLGLAAVLSILGAGRRSGTLALSREGQEARVILLTGHITSAVLDGPEPAEGLAAMDLLGRWTEGEFAFSEHPVGEEKKGSSRSIPKV